MPRRGDQDGSGAVLIAALAGGFLIAHGLVHLAVWVSPPPPDAPFDSRHSWLLGERPGLVRAMAAIACFIFVLAGPFVIAGMGAGAALAIIGAAVSLVLAVLTFHPWFLAAIAINLAIVVIALT